MSDKWLLASARISTVFAAGANGYNINDADAAASNGIENNTLKIRHVISNPLVVLNLMKLHDELVKMGYNADEFEIDVTGGSRYIDLDDKKIHRSLTDGSIVKNSNLKPLSNHLIELGARGVDFKFTGVSAEAVLKALEKTDFPTNSNIKTDYKDKHYHVGLPNTNYYRDPPSIEMKFPIPFIYKGGVFEQIEGLDKYIKNKEKK